MLHSSHPTPCACAGTLAINNIASLIKLMPEPSFLYSWLDFYEHKDMVLLLKKLFRTYPYLYNIQVGVQARSAGRCCYALP